MLNFYTNFETLTPEEYQNSIVNFYSQTLGKTGIQTTKPKEEEDDKDTGYVAPTIIPDDNQSGGTGISNILDFDYDIDNVVTFENLPSSYDEHLNNLGLDDKSDLTAFGLTAEKPSKEQFQKYGAAKGLSAVFGLTGLPIEIGASMIAGKSQKNIFGVEEFKPTGMMGVIQDFSESARLNSYNKNKTKYNEIKNAFAMGPEEFSTSPTKDFNDYMKGQDYGFSVNSKNAGSSIYRDFGSKIYNGAGMIGVDQETAKRMEALKRGYETSNFDPTDPTKSGSLVGAGYDERGYHHTINGVAAMGRKKDAEALGEMYGLTFDEVKNVLGDVRSRRSTFGRTIEGKTLSQMLSEAKDRKEQQQKQQQEQQQQQQQSDDVVDDDVVDSGFTATPKSKDDYFASMPTGGFFTDDDSDDNNDSPSDDASSSMGDVGGEGGYATAMGGRIGMQEGDVASNQVTVKEPGFIAPDPNATKQQEIADDKPMDAKNGDFIINAPAAEDAGKQDIQRMISTAITNLQEKGVDVRFGDPKINIRDKVKLLVSRNEVYIPAIIAKEIGYDRLKKINNRGKREVQRRQEESQQDEKPQARGFIEKKEGDVVDVTQRPDFKEADYMGDQNFPAQLLASITGVYNDSQKANLHARDYAKKYKPKDDDRSEDSLRHILGGGYMSDSIFKLLGYTGYNMREFGAFMDSIVGKKGTDPAGEESRKDLNNNRYGRVLRQKYPDENKFKAKAIEIARKLSQGKKGPVIDGISPMLSLGSEEATRRKEKQIEDMEYQVN